MFEAKKIRTLAQNIGALKNLYGDFSKAKRHDVEQCKNLFIKFARNIVGDDWQVVFPHCRYVFPAHSWSRARSSGNDFKAMLKNTLPKTFLTLFAIGQISGVDLVELSSLWRPWGGTAHPGGFGIDIIQLGRIITARTTRAPEPEGLDYVRQAIWDAGLISQWIGPWQVKLSETAPWHKNPALSRQDKSVSAIYSQHVDHIHLTAKT